MPQPPDRIRVTFELAEPVHAMLEQCLASGLFGDTLSEVVDRMICAEVGRLIGSGFINVTHDTPAERQLPRELGEGAARSRAQ